MMEREKNRENEELDWFWEYMEEEYQLKPSSFFGKYFKRNGMLKEEEKKRMKNELLEWEKEELKWNLKERIETLNTLSFDPYSFPIDGSQPLRLLILSLDMFQTLDLLQSLNISVSLFKRTLLVIRNNYRDVPFHNYYHSFNVAQSIYYLLQTRDMKIYFDSVELFSLLLSSLCHDVDHPGLNNAFLQNAKTKLKSRFESDEGNGGMDSLLEKYHCRKTFDILSRKDCNIFSQMKADDVKRIKEYVSCCILSTDLSLHGNYMERLRGLERINWENSEEKKWIMCTLIKCADISNEIRPSSIGRKWAQRVMTEFYAQSSLEKEKGLPVAPHMDPMKTTTASGQIGFINYLCLPFFKELTRLFPTMKVCCDQIIENREKWEKVKQEEGSNLESY
eukprot:TRINITY_DN4329_c0_g1_i1.p1 TRINITY_DN4329_c0_g1~~TRINITY_DN4329_c0_g1_i1.p1  ORF type:complete len:392 (-),score=77.11 TRINITY_DN4329_c0_g1_i1:42-1217(-)